MHAICYTKPGTTLTFWLNRFYLGGHIWSLVRTSTSENGEQRWNQPALRFADAGEGEAFIAAHLGGNPDARAVEVSD